MALAMNILKNKKILTIAIFLNISLFIFGLLSKNIDIMMISLASGSLCYIGTLGSEG